MEGYYGPGSLADLPNLIAYGGAKERAAIANTQAEAELRRQEAATAVQKNAAEVRRLQDEERMRQVMAEWQPQTEGLNGFVLRSSKAGVSPAFTIASAKSMADAQDAYAKMEKTQQEALAKKHEEELGAFQAVIQTPAGDLREAGRAQLLKRFPGLTPGQVTDEALPHTANLLKPGDWVISQNIRERETVAKETTAAARKSEAETRASEFAVKKPGEEAQSEMLRRQAEAMKTMTPESLDAQVDAIIPPQQHAEHNAATKQLVRGAMALGAKPETITGLLKDARDKIAGNTPEQQFINEYRRTHPGSSVQDAVTAYARSTQKPPEALMIGPDGRAIVVRPGTVVPTGAQTPGGVSTGNTLTAANRTRAEFAATVSAGVPELQARVDALESKIGPGTGRWNKLWVNRGGFDDPDFASLDEDLRFFASALVVAHFGARGGGQKFREQLEHDFSQAQSPANLKARIESADRTMARYAAQGKTPAQAGTALHKTAGGAKIRARDAQGKLHEAPAGTPVPAGWTLEK